MNYRMNTSSPFLNASSFFTWTRKSVFLLLLSWGVILGGGCRGEAPSRPLSEAQQPTTSHAVSSLDFGRVTSILEQQDVLYFGHENGGISQWKPQITLSSHPVRSWVAHDGAVRALTSIRNHAVRSVGADGSWADWTGEGRGVYRGRISGFHINALLPLEAEGSVAATDRGVVMRLEGTQRLWRSAGEHGRAAFALLRMGSSQVLSVGTDGRGRCWSLTDGRACGEAPLHQGWITVALSIDGQLLTAGRDGYIKIWGNLDEGLFQRFNSRPLEADLALPEVDLSVHPNGITQLKIAPVEDGFLILSGGEDGSLALSRFTRSTTGSWDLTRLWLTQNEDFRPILSLTLNVSLRRALISGGKSGQIVQISLPLDLKKTPRIQDNLIPQMKRVQCFGDLSRCSP